ncbi:4Fe-4S dicluster domain-containing protein [Desulfoscipio geothermicus]|uniref:Carbon-monoxide dehydrogenase iron sulfur subunit n=1 Tax=Desulfoscipio geothermicus DSM 3669 TaxID=1121426 RepID=A0A1I6DPL7_9FIRM|nr:4Fe-4S dicluster domain-containing protein [Desulfoscipio geothermicus]SFR07384.1 carbon-monoxide dehydrogenase iron sulfur subunit [Desulfoscipio geothermicus DSM 3669]
MGRVVAKPEVCIGCRLCEIWCSVAHSRSRNIIKTFLYEEKKPFPRVTVEEKLPLTFAIQCRHCAEPDCVAACIGGALFKDPASGRVVHDREKCVGCYSCVLTCPYGSIVVDPKRREVFKCDLCAGLDELYCVSHCPNEALVYVPEE